MKNIKTILFIFSSALLFLLAAFFNGYPLVYSDTSTYLSSGFELETPADRPITYGLFLRLSSLNGLSLWLTVFFQSLLLVYLIYRVVLVLKIEKPFVKTFLISLICALTTGVSFTSSQLIADVFTPMLILLWILICVDTEASKRRILFYGLFLVFVSSMHMSHFVMSVFFVVLILFLRINRSIRENVSLLRLGVIVLASGLSFLVFASSYAKYKHVFFVAKMNESKLLKKILTDKCKDIDFKLCAYKDSLPNTANDFIWDSNSPLNKLGGYKEVRPEFNKIIGISLTTKEYLFDMLSYSGKESCKQLVSYDIGDGNGVFMKGTLLHERLTKYVPNEIDQYAGSKQQKGEMLSVNYINKYFSITLLVGICGLIFIFSKRELSFNLKAVGVVLLLGILINALVCGSLAPLADRFGCRVIWFIIFYFCLLYFKLYSRKKEINENS